MFAQYRRYPEHAVFRMTFDIGGRNRERLAELSALCRRWQHKMLAGGLNGNVLVPFIVGNEKVEPTREDVFIGLGHLELELLLEHSLEY